jgi:hypothetical protein
MDMILCYMYAIMLLSQLLLRSLIRLSDNFCFDQYSNKWNVFYLKNRTNSNRMQFFLIRHKNPVYQVIRNIKKNFAVHI